MLCFLEKVPWLFTSISTLDKVTYLRGHLLQNRHRQKSPKRSKDFERRIPEKRDIFKVLKLSMQDDSKLKLLLVPNYVINAVRPAVLCLSCNIIETICKRRGNSSEDLRAKKFWAKRNSCLDVA